jgi:hypothetical protein
MARSRTVPIALLTPIGIMHLDSAGGMPKVAFGTRAWDTVQEFATVGGPGAQVLFYASYSAGATRPTVTWTAEFRRRDRSRRQRRATELHSALAPEIDQR